MAHELSASVPAFCNGFNLVNLNIGATVTINGLPEHRCHCQHNDSRASKDDYLKSILLLGSLHVNNIIIFKYNLLHG